MDALRIEIEPWPAYSSSGKALNWHVRVSTRKRSVKLKWARELGRFIMTDSLMRLRRAEPDAHRKAVEVMREFCSKNEQPELRTVVTVASDAVTQSSESVTDGPTNKRDTLARARIPSGDDVTVSRVTEDRDTQRDSDIAALELRNVTITPAEARRQEDRRRLAADPRFGIWAARSSCEA